MSEHPTLTDDATAVLPTVHPAPPVPHHRTEPEPPADDSGRPLVTIVLPCYNEREHVIAEVERICAAMDASGMTYELLAIDDASTDDTLTLLLEARSRFPSMRIMPFRRNGGSGTARRIGTLEARGEIVAWTDADMTYPNERIPELVSMLVDDPTYDQVVGARTSEEGTHKILRVPAKWVIRKIAEKLSNSSIPDLNSGLRAFRRSVRSPETGVEAMTSVRQLSSRLRAARTAGGRARASSTPCPRTSGWRLRAGLRRRSTSARSRSVG